MRSRQNCLFLFSSPLWRSVFSACGSLLYQPLFPCLVYLVFVLVCPLCLYYSRLFGCLHLSLSVDTRDTGRSYFILLTDRICLCSLPPGLCDGFGRS